MRQKFIGFFFFLGWQETVEEFTDGHQSGVNRTGSWRIDVDQWFCQTADIFAKKIC